MAFHRSAIDCMTDPSVSLCHVSSVKRAKLSTGTPSQVRSLISRQSEPPLSCTPYNSTVRSENKAFQLIMHKHTGAPTVKCVCTREHGYTPRALARTHTQARFPTCVRASHRREQGDNWQPRQSADGRQHSPGILESQDRRLLGGCVCARYIYTLWHSLILNFNSYSFLIYLFITFMLN